MKDGVFYTPKRDTYSVNNRGDTVRVLAESVMIKARDSPLKTTFATATYSVRHLWERSWTPRACSQKNSCVSVYLPHKTVFRHQKSHKRGERADEPHIESRIKHARRSEIVGTTRNTCRGGRRLLEKTNRCSHARFRCLRCRLFEVRFPAGSSNSARTSSTKRGGIKKKEPNTKIQISD